MSTQPVPRHPRGVSALKVLGIVFLVLVVACGGVAFYIYRNFKSIASNWVYQTTTQALAQADLPQAQKDSIQGNLDRLLADFQSGAISVDDLKGIMNRLEQGPFFMLVQAEFVRQKCLKELQLTDEQKPDLKLTFDRFQRAIVEDKVPAQQLREIMGEVENQQASGQSKEIEVRKDLSKEELQGFVDRIRKAADDAGIPQEPYQVDFAGMFQKAIDGVLNPEPEAEEPETKPAEQ